MPKFNYVALDAKGKETTGSMDADSSNTVVAKLREGGFFPTNVSEASAGTKKSSRGQASPTVAAAKSQGKKGFNINLSTGKVKGKVLTAFTRQLATLIDAGLPLLRGLGVLQKQEKDVTLRNAIRSMSESVEAGSTFSESLALHPKIFTRLYVNMVRAGEAGGVLDVTLNRLAEFQEKAQKIKNKVVSAMVYPSVVIFVALVILVFLMTVIVPKFQEIFKDLLNEGAELPGLTLFVLFLSNLIRQQILLVIAAVAGFVIGLKIFGKTKKGRFLLDKFKLNAPVFGPLLRKVGIARFTRTLGTLIASGVPILQALNIVKETAGNAVIEDAVVKIHDAVKEGERIVQPLEACGVFPPMVISMVDVGEETGALPDMLMKVADVYDDEVDNAVGALTSLLEPIMIVFLAIIVGTIVIAMFLPLIKVMSELGK